MVEKVANFYIVKQLCFQTKNDHCLSSEQILLLMSNGQIFRLVWVPGSDLWSTALHCTHCIALLFTIYIYHLIHHISITSWHYLSTIHILYLYVFLFSIVVHKFYPFGLLKALYCSKQHYVATFPVNNI